MKCGTLLSAIKETSWPPHPRYRPAPHNWHSWAMDLSAEDGTYASSQSCMSPQPNASACATHSRALQPCKSAWSQHICRGLQYLSNSMRHGAQTRIPLAKQQSLAVSQPHTHHTHHTPHLYTVLCARRTAVCCCGVCAHTPGVPLFATSCQATRDPCCMSHGAHMTTCCSHAVKTAS
jgi:hypothetical protein